MGFVFQKFLIEPCYIYCVEYIVYDVHWVMCMTMKLKVNKVNFFSSQSISCGYPQGFELSSNGQ